VGDPIQASNAWAMGNVGLSTVLRDEDNDDPFDDEDAPDLPSLSWWQRGVGRLTRWAVGGGVFLALSNQWPGGR
jgi:hypothetical protein